jgi:hypothetical protein
MLRVVLILLVVAFYIYFVIDVARTPRGQTRTLPKFVWLLIVILLPIIGGVLWLLLGRVWPANGSPFGRKRGPVAPDDDPKFMRKLDDDVWSKKMRKRRGEATS